MTEEYTLRCDAIDKMGYMRDAFADALERLALHYTTDNVTIQGRTLPRIDMESVVSAQAYLRGVLAAGMMELTNNLEWDGMDEPECKIMATLLENLR